MLMDLKQNLSEMKRRLEDLRDALDLPALTAKIDDLEAKSAEPGFWDDRNAAQVVLRETTALKSKVDGFRKVETQLEDVEVYWELAVEEEDEGLEPEIAAQCADCEKAVDALELDTLLSDKYDGHSAMLSIHAGSGGVEAQDWASMLYRMYTRYCEKHGFKVEVMDFLPGDEAGIKSVTFSVEGVNAYGYLKAEKGVHRLVRISPFDAAKRRHTSFSSLDVIPQVDFDDEIELKEDDYRKDTFRASGAGGQHINKTDSAIRLTHYETGIVVSCQDERSQHANLDKALRLLKAKLLERQRLAQEEEINGIRGEQQDNGWGSQIRSYVFAPYKLVKDHRTQVEVGNVDAVMDGDIDAFIFGYLKSIVKSEA
ncbi:MAG: peptide chain release factor 2 [Firmicutes bacterium]|nr:peptide chain release factor 2 [Bacillota bacterium]